MSLCRCAENKSLVCSCQQTMEPVLNTVVSPLSHTMTHLQIEREAFSSPVLHSHYEFFFKASGWPQSSALVDVVVFIVNLSFLPGAREAFLFGKSPQRKIKAFKSVKFLERVGGDGSLTLFKYLLLRYYRKANLHVLGNPATMSVLCEKVPIQITNFGLPSQKREGEEEEGEGEGKRERRERERERERGVCVCK